MAKAVIRGKFIAFIKKIKNKWEKELLSLTTTWKKLENIMQSEMSQIQTDKSCVIPPLYVI